MAQEKGIEFDLLNDLEESNIADKSQTIAVSRKASQDTMEKVQVEQEKVEQEKAQEAQEAQETQEVKKEVSEDTVTGKELSIATLRAQSEKLDNILAKSHIIHGSATHTVHVQQVQVQVHVQKDAKETTRHLYDLHSKVDRILSPTKVQYSYESSSIHSPSYLSATNFYSPTTLKTVRFVEDIKHAVSSTNSPYKSSLALDAAKTYSSDKTTHIYAHSAHLPRHVNFKLGYDKEKLDNIIGGIVRSSHISKSAGLRSSYISDANYSRTSYREPVHQAYQAHHAHHAHYAHHAHQARYEQPKKADNFGQVEFDQDSIVDEILEDNIGQLESEKQNLVNHYVGSLVDDLDESPRKKRVGHNQTPSKSTSKKSTRSSSEFVKKGPYDRKVKEKLSPADLKKHFEKDINLIEDFDFARRVKVGRH